jgi:hypothetical protein
MDTPQVRSRTSLLALAITECLLVLPATFAVAVAALCRLQPGQYEPARTSWIILEWMTTHLSKVDAAAMFLVLPAIALAAGSMALLRSWQQDDLLRWDAIAFIAVLRRNLQVVILAAGTCVGAAILMAAVVHIITD